MKYLIANWKMNPATRREALGWIGAFDKLTAKNVSVWAAVPSLYLCGMSAQHVTLGVQNVHPGTVGAVTGEVSALMAKNSGARFTILGHSERKRLGETQHLIREKIDAALAQKLKVALCFGEEKPVRARQRLLASLKTELLFLLRSKKIRTDNMLLVYEPAWAISTQGKGADDPRAALDTVRALDAWAQEKFKKRFTFLYGGSVDETNVKSFVQEPIVGALVGHASLNPKQFARIVLALDAL